MKLHIVCIIFLKIGWDFNTGTNIEDIERDNEFVENLLNDFKNNLHKQTILHEAKFDDLKSIMHGGIWRRSSEDFSVGIKYSFINNKNHVQNVETSGVLYKYGEKCYIVSIYNTLVSPRIIKDNKYNTTNIQLHDIETLTFVDTRAYPVTYNNVSFETLYFENSYKYPNDIAAINISCGNAPILKHFKIKIAKLTDSEYPPNPLHGDYVNTQDHYYRTAIISTIYNESNDVDSLNSLKQKYIIGTYGHPNDSIRFDFSGCGLFSTNDRLVGFYADDKYYYTDEEYNQDGIHYINGSTSTNSNQEYKHIYNVSYENNNDIYKKTTKVSNIVFAQNIKTLFKSKVHINET